MNSFVFQLIVSYVFGLLLHVTVLSPILQMERWFMGDAYEDDVNMKDMPGTVFVNAKRNPCL